MSDTNSGTHPVFEVELNTAIRAARAAGALIQDRAGHIEEETVREKAMNDLVTEVDEDAQRLIIRILGDTFPNAAFLAEEGDAFSSDDSAEGDLWIIDPIDGTTNFTRGIPPYAVSIALRRNGETVVGVVLDVPRDEIFTAVRGRGLNVNGRRGYVSSRKTMSEGVLTTGFPYRALDHVEIYLEVLGEFMRKSLGVRRPGSAAVDLAYVACGRFDGFFETGLSVWDVAAGSLLVEEGGGRVTDYRGGTATADQIVATNGSIHDEMLEIVHPMKDVHL